MKQINSYALLMVLTIFSCIKTFAYDVEINGIYYNLKPAKVGTASVTYNSKNNYSGSIVIPETIEYDGNIYTITEIGNMAFMGCRDLISVDLPNTITSIGTDGFENCTNLQSINIPTNLTTIKNDAFQGCTGLKKVVIPDVKSWCDIDFGDNGNPLYFARHLFIGDDEIHDLIIPDGVVTIKTRAFIGFSELRTISISSSVNSIGSAAFYECVSLMDVSIPQNVTSIESQAFYGCTGLLNINLPSSLSSISSNCFENCSKLELVSIPEGIQIIDKYAFSKCTNLKKVYIPSSMKRIGASAFGNCENISDIYCFASEPPIPNGLFAKKSVSDYFMNSYVEYSTLHVPEASIAAYNNDEYWSDFGSIVALTDADTGIEEAKDKSRKIKHYFSIEGKQLNALQKGINIIKMSNGQTKKIIVK